MLKNNIYLIENHHEAYSLWKKNNISNTTLVHIDAHIDYDQNKLALTNDQNITIGNFIYPAVETGMIKSFYWVIPGTKESFSHNIFAIKQLILKLQTHEKATFEKYLEGIIILKLEKITLYICVLETLPKLVDPVLLDIDVDFFINCSLNESQAVQNIGKKKQWLSVGQFLKQIKNKLKNVSLTTIVYSTNGGWTPMKYKTIGDQLAQGLGINDKNLFSRILAGNYFKRFRSLLDKNRFTESKKNYLAALGLNPMYMDKDINYVFLYLINNQIDLALTEVRKFLKIDSENGLYQAQLGIIYLKKNQLSNARKYIEMGMSFKPMSNICRIYLCYVEIKKNNWEKAYGIFKSINQKEVNDVYIFFQGLINFHLKKDGYHKKYFYQFLKSPINLPVLIGMEDLQS